MHFAKSALKVSMYAKNVYKCRMNKIWYSNHMFLIHNLFSVSSRASYQEVVKKQTQF